MKRFALLLTVGISTLAGCLSETDVEDEALTDCDDGTALVDDGTALARFCSDDPGCPAETITAIQDGCYVCADPFTCEPDFNSAASAKPQAQANIPKAAGSALPPPARKQD